MQRSLHVQIRGDVQGVGFRAFTRREAERRGLGGWVRNLLGGSVETYAEGEESALRDWLSCLHRGPGAARVEEVLPVWGEPRGISSGFEVRASATRPEPFDLG
ncbi:MAG: acylphosphatase [Armatimonadetes bacterium]|nr:acylphosphatase [Armatimonadota bacterium]